VAILPSTLGPSGQVLKVRATLRVAARSKTQPRGPSSPIKSCPALAANWKLCLRVRRSPVQIIASNPTAFDSPLSGQMPILSRVFSYSGLITDRVGVAVNVVRGTGLVGAGPAETSPRRHVWGSVLGEGN